jgi:hypothetical protein
MNGRADLGRDENPFLEVSNLSYPLTTHRQRLNRQ